MTAGKARHLQYTPAEPSDFHFSRRNAAAEKPDLTVSARLKSPTRYRGGQSNRELKQVAVAVGWCSSPSSRFSFSEGRSLKLIPDWRLTRLGPCSRQKLRRERRASVNSSKLN